MPPLLEHCTKYSHANVIGFFGSWDDERDAKENHWSDASDASEKFRQKQLRNATIVVLRRQMPLTNALDGFYLPCVDCMLEACWVEGCVVSLSRHTCV